MSQFTIEQVEKIAQLANLDLTAEEKRTFAAQFTAILDYFAKIGQAKLPPDSELAKDNAPTVMRDDEPEASGVSPESFSEYLENRHFKVPRVIE
jgi:aspartyl-tRNA(Asn)/glutamyl-tRNA(Gln) amidotransferase subunit C